MSAAHVIDHEQAEQQQLTLSPMQMIQVAIDQKADVDKLAKLMDLALRWDANEARKAYVAALARFKANPPDINKTHKVDYPNKDGSRTTYHHSELDVINDIIQPALQKEGLYATWKLGDSNGRVLVTCVLTHTKGHSEEIATLSGPADTSGGKNNIQGIGSTTSYLKRYTLESGLGLVAKGADDDGQSSQGMTDEAVKEYTIQMQDATTLPDLQKVFGECWEKSKKIRDDRAQDTFRKVYETRKRELRQ